MNISNDIRYLGVNDHNIDLFEGQYIVPNGMAYNSYVILDKKTAVMDTVDAAFTHEWLDNIAEVLGIEENRINVKATTEERLGFTGRGEGIAAQAVCLLN